MRMFGLKSVRMVFFSASQASRPDHAACPIEQHKREPPLVGFVGTIDRRAHRQSGGKSSHPIPASKEDLVHASMVVPGATGPMKGDLTYLHDERLIVGSSARGCRMLQLVVHRYARVMGGLEGLIRTPPVSDHSTCSHSDNLLVGCLLDLCGSRCRQ